ncbi:MAG: hypothetical protein GY856_35135 [bacterium]|nr:hypothetical protein [bacterium]
MITNGESTPTEDLTGQRYRMSSAGWVPHEDAYDLGKTASSRALIEGRED